MSDRSDDRTMDVSFWHRTAYLFLKQELRLPDVVRFMIIATAVGLVEDDTGEDAKVGYNVLDHSRLNDALVFGLLLRHDSSQPLSYATMGKWLLKHPQTVGGAVNRLIERGIIVKDDHGAIGSYYAIVPDMAERFQIPLWVKLFAAAIIDLETLPEFRAEVEEKMQDVGFTRGLQVLRDELREKFSPKRPKAE